MKLITFDPAIVMENVRVPNVRMGGRLYSLISHICKTQKKCEL